MEKVFTVIRWKLSAQTFMGYEYTYNSIICTFKSRKAATDYIKNIIGAKYEKGNYAKGDYLYSIKQNDLKDERDARNTSSESKAE